MTADPPIYAAILAGQLHERDRITKPLDELIAEYKSRPPNYDLPGEAVVDILEYLKEYVNGSIPKEETKKADYPGRCI